jgi:integrase
MAKKAKKDRDGLHRRPNIPQGIYYFYYRGTDGRWREKSTGTASYTEAREIRHRELDKIRSGNMPSAFRDWTLEKVAHLWLERQKALVPSAITVAGYHWILRPLLAKFGGKKLKEISVENVLAYQAERAMECSHRTVNRELQTLMRIMRLAGLGAAFSDVKSLADRPSGIGRVLSIEEDERFWEVASSRSGWQMISWVALLAANTGLRGGEIKRLRFGDIFLEKQIIIVRRPSTKTDAGARLIPLNPSALFATERLLNRAKLLGAHLSEHFLLPANPGKHTKDAVTPAAGFDTSNHQRSWRSAWRSLTRAAGLRGLRFHDLRHHFITRLAEASVPIQIAMSLAGHMSPEMTRHYTHISDRAVRDAVNALSPGKLILPLQSPRLLNQKSLGEHYET